MRNATTIMFNRFSTLALAISALVFTAGSAQAAEVDAVDSVTAAAATPSDDAVATPVERHLWVTSGFLSYHYTKPQPWERQFNQNNLGVGVEYAINPNWTVAAGRYANSVWKHSNYLQALYTPDATSFRVSNVDIKMGVAVGTVNGYSDMNHGKYAPAALPVISLETQRVGFNLTVIPTMFGNTVGAYAIQFKVKAF